MKGQRLCCLTNSLREAHDLFDRLTLHVQRDQQGGNLSVGGSPGEDFGHDCARFFARQRFALVGNPLQGVGDHGVGTRVASFPHTIRRFGPDQAACNQRHDSRRNNGPVCPIGDPSIKLNVAKLLPYAASQVVPIGLVGIIMKIHEYQAKNILKKYGVAVPRGEMVETREAAEAAAKKLFDAAATGVVVKAQIHAGGRGKGGGVKIAKSVAEAAELAGRILGMKLVTHQTGPEGKEVHRLLIEETLPIERELYLGIVLDRAEARPVFMASSAGGMEIEQVAAENPEAIIKEYIDPGTGLLGYQARKLAFGLGLAPQLIGQASQFMTGLYRAFEETDASLMEINPFITTKDGRLFALDAKINFDDSALFRHKDIKELRDASEEDPLEVEASKYALNYIKLDGNVGCMVNGAGLAMA